MSDPQADEREQQRLARKARRQQAKRRRILAAAQTLLAEGPDRLTVAALAEVADTSPSTLYYYFPSVESVIEGLAVQLITDETEAMVAALEREPDPIDALVAVMEARVAFYRANPQPFWTLFDQLFGLRFSAETLEEQVYPLAARTMAPLAERLAEGQAAGTVHPDLDPRRFANLAYLTVQGILQMTVSMELAGGAMRYPVEALLAEATASVRRAARP